MDIIYQINQSNKADSITNAQNIPRSLNLDTESKVLRVVPTGQETTTGYEFPSTESAQYGKVFVGVVGGKRIYKELKDCIVNGQGTTVAPVIMPDGSDGVKVSTNIIGSDGIVVQPNGDAVNVGFSSTNRDGITGFSLTRFAGEDWNLYNPTLVSPKNPDWIKNIPSSQIHTEETTTTKTYEFVVPKDGIWNVVYNFNDVWNSIRPITGLSTYTADDFGRDFEVKIDIIKNNVSVIGVQQQYRLKVDADVTKYQEIVDGMDSYFIVDRVSNSGGASVYLYGLYLDENYDIIDASSYVQFASGSDGSPYFKRVLVEFLNGEAEIKDSVTIESHIAEAKYIVWSFSKSEIITKTITPSGDVGTISIAHQSVRASENGTVVDNTFDRSFWLMLETGDTVRARCIFESGELAPMCEASFSALYMLPGVTIGSTPVAPKELYDFVITESTHWKEAMENVNVETIFVPDAFTIPSSIINYRGNKIIYGQSLMVDADITIGSDVDKRVDIYNNVYLQSGSTQTITCKNVRFRHISSVTASNKVISAPSTYYGLYESNYSVSGNITGGSQNFWDNTNKINSTTLSGYVKTTTDQNIDGEKTFIKPTTISTISNNAEYISVTETPTTISLQRNNKSLLVIVSDNAPPTANLIINASGPNPPIEGTKYTITFKVTSNPASQELTVSLTCNGTTVTKYINRCYCASFRYFEGNLIWEV